MRVNVKGKLLGLAAILIAFMVAIGLLSILNLGSVNSLAGSMYADRVLPLQQLGESGTQLMNMRRIVTLGVTQIGDEAAQARVDADLAAARQVVDEQMAAYAATFLLDAEKAALAEFEDQYAAYLAAVEGIRALTTAGDVVAAQQALLDAAPVGAGASDTLSALRTINSDEASNLAGSIASTADTSRLTILAALVLAALVGFVIAVVLARRVVKGVTEVQVTLASLTDHCATRLAEGLTRLRDGDLTYEVSPVTQRIEHYGTDEIGKTAESANAMRDRLVAAITAYNESRDGLARTITQVKEAAGSVAVTSEQLTTAATQTGAATQQVATTISQVAGGTAEQARAASDTNAAVEELAAVIATVGQGAVETEAAVGRSLEAVGSMQTALGASEAAATDLKPANERAADALTKVTAAISDNAAGMARIKAAVDDSAVKVAELGAKGEQIGAIVETIDDIAEQTNLLALNAAIEAARAGEMGKGFAVVADEVRKLAERSGRATKEIADLIADVQKGTSQAVSAMNAGSVEVEQGLEIGRRGSESVLEIEEATVARNEALERVFGALEQIEAAAGQVATSSDEIARIVAQTAAGATQMADASDAVTRSISSIAAVSEENSAATEEVSAATEEMSAQAEEVVASASTLSDMAQQLDALVAAFRLKGQAGQAGAEFDAFRRAHKAWVHRAEAMLNGSEQIDPAQLGDHTKCGLGQWYTGMGRAQHGGNPRFAAIEAPHKAMHEAVRRAASAHAAGNRSAAQSAVAEVGRHSAAVIEALDALEASTGGQDGGARSLRAA